MPDFILDETNQQRKRWLIRNGLGLPVMVALIAFCLYQPGWFLHLVGYVAIAANVYILVLGALFRRLTVYRDSQQFSLELRCLGWFTVYSITKSTSECAAVHYHAYHLPSGRRLQNLNYFGAIYLLMVDGRRWRIADQGYASMDIECDEVLAEKLAEALGVPLERLTTPPFR